MAGKESQVMGCVSLLVHLAVTKCHKLGVLKKINVFPQKFVDQNSRVEA